jgi:hypothetical protein
MSKRIKAQVGTLEEMGQRFVNAWHRLEMRLQKDHLSGKGIGTPTGSPQPWRCDVHLTLAIQ